MKVKLFVSSVASLLLSASSYATVTLQFSTSSAKLTNIQNAAGNATGGLRWGIVINTDTPATGFDANGLNYDGFTFPTAGNGVFLANGVTGLPTDDFFFFGATLNTTLATVSGTDSGTNVIPSISGVPIGVNGIGAGDNFALIWFDTSTTNDGDKYGFLYDSSFTIPLNLPADGATLDYSPNFVGADPVRLASNTLGAVPEPSRLMLLGIGGLGLLFRRRRC
jgi:PEP-CTERM motif